LQALEQKRLLKIDGRPTDALPFEVDTYLDTVGNVSVASHLSNLPVMATDASTSNFIVLPTGVISKTGACAQIADGNVADIKARRIVNLIEASLEDKRHGDLWHTFYFIQGRLDNANRAVTANTPV